MKRLRSWRTLFFEVLGEKRSARIALCTLVIMLIWVLADVLSGNYKINYWHDVICLILGITAERVIPWGKNEKMDLIANNNEKLKESNKELLGALKEANVILKNLQDDYVIIKKEDLKEDLVNEG